MSISIDPTGQGRKGSAQSQPSLGARVGDAALTIASVCGAVCILLVALAFFFDVTLIMFKTGSMSPTMPTGTLAVVRETPAGKIAVGDVVTVSREDALPVTHRVTSVADGPTDRQRVMTLKGDANEAPDPAPYTVETVRKVAFAVPGLAFVIVWLSDPRVLGILAISVSALVTWAFWPRRGDKRGNSGEAGKPPKRARGPRARHARTPPLALVAFSLLISACLTIMVGANTAHADSGEEVRSSSHLTVTSIADHSAMGALAPGASVEWQVGISADDKDPGGVVITLAGSGEEGLGLGASITTCDMRWVAGACEGDARSMDMPEVVPLDGEHRLLETMITGEELWLRIVVTIPMDSSAERGDNVQLTVRAAAEGESVATAPQEISALPQTGARVIPALLTALAAVLAGLLGAGMASLVRRRELR